MATLSVKGEIVAEGRIKKTRPLIFPPMKPQALASITRRQLLMVLELAVHWKD